MTYTFRSITEARNHLLESGYRFAGYGKVGLDAELYKAGPLMAILRKAPFAGYRVRIG